MLRLLILTCLLLPGLALAQPDIQHWKTRNGAQVYFIETHALPMIDIRLVFDAASARDPAGLQGLAMMTSDMLLEGSGERDGLAVAEAFEGRGAEIAASSLRDMAIVSMRSLSGAEYLDPLLPLLADVVSRPTFPAEALERERSRALRALQFEQQSPDTVGERRLYELLYGSHPYANPEIGTEQGIRAIKRKHLVEFHRDHYVASNMVIALVGDVDRKQAEHIAELISNRLPAGEAAPPLPEVPPSRGQREHIEFPSTQTHILLGQRGIRRDDERYFALKIGNHGLGGGGFQSRLQHEIREKRGLSYDAYSYFLPMQQAGPFLAGLSTANQQADQALAITRQVISEYLAQGPSEDEVTMAKKNITGGFPLSIDSNRELVSTLAVIGFYHLPTDYLDTYIARVNAVTAKQVRDAFRSLLSMDEMITVSVGADAEAN